MPTLPSAVLSVPADRQMTEKIGKISGLAWAAKEVTRRRYEKYARLALIGGGTAVTAAGFPELWRVFQETCRALSIAEPEFFLVDRPGAVPEVLGEEKPLLMLPVSLLAGGEKAWRVALAGALTHIHCGHLPYLAMRALAAAAADNLGIIKSAVSLPRMYLEEWYYAAQMSADRGALWVTGDLPLVLEELCARALPANPAGRLTPETLLAQGERYLAELDALPACPLFHTWSNLYFNLPRYALRAVELKKWAESAEYRAFRAGDFSGGAARAEETPAYWGAFAGGENPWASAGAADDPETADFLFGLNRKEWLVSGAQSLAAGAGNFARTGAQALGDAASAFINALKKE